MPTVTSCGMQRLGVDHFFSIFSYLFVLRGLIPSARFRVRALGRLKGIKHRM